MRRFAPLVPYVTVTIGIEVFERGFIGYFLNHAVILVWLGACGYLRNAGMLFRGWRRSTAVPFLALSGLGPALVAFLWPYTGLDTTVQAELARFRLTGPVWFALLAYNALVNPWVEELYWRGYLANRSTKPAFIDLAFAGYHAIVLRHYVGWGWVLFSLAVLAVASYAWRQLARELDGLLVPALSHLIGGGGLLLMVHAMAG